MSGLPQTISPRLRLVRFGFQGAHATGLIDGERVLDLGAAATALGLDDQRVSPQPGGPYQSLFDRWERTLDDLRRIQDRASAAGLEEAFRPLADVELRAPVKPAKLLFAGANYSKHREEARRWLGPDAGDDAGEKLPYLFMRFPETIIGPADAVLIPSHYEQLDYEVELGAVIGSPGKCIPPERALEHVAAFLVVNDFSLRDLQRRPDWPEMSTDWLAGKNFDGSCSTGPYLVPRECIADYRQLRLRLSVNGELRQDALAGEMTFSLEEQIAFVSSFLTLNPGDLISTGTPAGVAFALPGTPWLRPGDLVEAEITGLGRQANKVKREPPA